MADKEPKKIKILIHGDSPRSATGFSKVIWGVFTNLAKTGRYDITIFGVNDIGGWYDQEKYPYKIYPAMLAGVQGDFYGRIRFINILRGVDLVVKPPWDIVFTLNDPFIYEEPVLTPEVGMMDAVHDIHKLYRDKMPPEAFFDTVSYWPVDSSLKENWIDHAVGLANYSVAYNNYGKREIIKANEKVDKPFDLADMPIIYHGVDTKVFHPVDSATKMEFRKKFFSKAKVDITNTFIVGMVARNQMRKDIPRAMKIFKEFQRRRPDSMLYIHAKEQDAWGSLGEYARHFKLELARDWLFPGNFSENIGYPVDALNLIYNVMDVNLNTSLGEGFSLPILEAMATKTLNLYPNHTAIPELFNTEGKDFDDPADLAKDETIRGVPIKNFSTSSEWVTHGPQDLERIRPLTNVDDAVKKLIWIYDNQEEAAKISERAYTWVQDYTWENMAQKWDELFQKVYNNLEEERKQAKQQKAKEVEEKDASSKDSDKPDRPEPVVTKRDESGGVPQTEGQPKDNRTVPVTDSDGENGQ